MSVMNMDVQILKKKKKKKKERNEQIKFNSIQLCHNIHKGFVPGPTADTKIYGSSSPLYKKNLHIDVYSSLAHNCQIWKQPRCLQKVDGK